MQNPGEGLAAQRPYGYVDFYAELTPHLCDGENEIEIIADNADTPNSRYYSGGRRIYESNSSEDRTHGKPDGDRH